MKDEGRGMRDGRHGAVLRGGRGMRGAAVVEFLVALPALLLVGLGGWQAALMYNAKTTLGYATFEAARVGAVSHAQGGAMRRELGVRLAPLYGGDGSARKAMAALTRASLDVQDSRHARIDIINPTKEAFDDFGTEIVDPRTGEIRRGIPNSHLRYRSRTVGKNSGVTIQDANLLKIKATYGYKLTVPLMSRVIPAVMGRLDPANRAFYDAGRIPLTAVATVRMQSDAWPDGNAPSAGAGGGGAAPPDEGNGEATTAPGGSADEGTPSPGDSRGDTDTDPPPTDTDTGQGNPNSGGCQTCQQVAGGSGGLFDIGGGSGGLFDLGGGNNANVQACPVNTQTGNPIQVVTGNKYQQEVDLAPLPGVLGLAFRRHYNSNERYRGALGANWRHDYAHRLSRVVGGERYRLVQGDGRALIFTATGKAGRYRAVRAADGHLQILADGGALWQWPDGRRLHYDAGGRLQRIVAADGQTLRLYYNDQDQLFLIRDPQGRELGLTYYPDGRLKQLLDPTGRVTRYRYDGRGNLAGVTHADGRTRTYHYEDSRHPHALTGITDARGIRYARWAYDAGGRAIESSHIGNVGKVTLDYSTPGQTRVTDSQGRVSLYHTDTRHGTAVVTRIDGPGCSSCGNGDVQYAYNDRLQLTEVIKKNGDTTHYAYDEQGRVTRITQNTLSGGSRLIAGYEYDGANRKPAVIVRPSINPVGEHRIEITYDAQGQPVKITEHGYRPAGEHGYTPIQRTTRLAYTDSLLTTIDGPRDDVDDLLRLTYDAHNRLKRFTGPDGIALRVTRYDAYGRPTRIRRGNQGPIDIGYTGRGQVESVSQYGQRIHYRYTASGKLKRITTPDGGTITLDYDAADRAVGITGPDGRRIEDEIDSEGHLVQRNLLGPDGQLIQSLSHLYDARGRLQSTRRNGGLVRQYDYDPQGRLTALTNSEEGITRLDYGPLGQLQHLIAPDQSRLTLHYDDKGQPGGLTDPRNNTTRQLRDDFGNLVRQSNPDTGAVSYRHDAAGNVIQKTDARGRVTHYRYDAANRLIEERGPDGTTTLAYDPQSGQLARIETRDPTGKPVSSETFEYNTEGRLTAHTREIDGHRFTTRYAYDEQRRLSRKHLPDGQVLHYHHYATGPQKGKLRAITRETLFGFGQETLIGEIDHDKRDGETGHTHGNGIRTEYHWDAAGRLTHIRTTAGLQLNYTYDDRGRITGIDLDGRSQAYRYDPWGRLAGADTAQGQYRYRYDKLGNRTEKQHTAPGGDTTTERYTYPEEGAGNRLLAIERDDGHGGRLAYDPAGSPARSDGLAYAYDAHQRPVKVFREHDGQKQLLAEYTYNRFGERIRKVVYDVQGCTNAAGAGCAGAAGNSKKPKVTYYLYDGPSLTAEADESGAITAQYLYLDGHRPVAKLEHKTVYAIHSDHRGAPRLVTGGNGETVWRADYTPFGKAEISSGRITLNLRLAGQYADAETGLHYNYQRYYDPETGRYTTADPIGLRGGLNLYAYVYNDPLGAIDPLGLAADDILGRSGGNWGLGAPLSTGSPAEPSVGKPAAAETLDPNNSFVQKLASVAQGSLHHLTGEVKQQIEQMFTEEALLLNAGIMAGIAGLQAVPGVNVVVDVVMVGFAWWHFGSSGVEFVTQMAGIVRDIYLLDATACDANRQLADLSERFADAIWVLGDAVTSFFDRGSKLGIKPKNEAWMRREVRKTEGELNENFLGFLNKDLLKVPGAFGNKVRGFYGETMAAMHFEQKGYTPVGATLNTRDIKNRNDFDKAQRKWDGQQGIDGIYRDKDGNYVIVESKATGKLFANDPGGTKGKLTKPQSGRQLSDDWITGNIQKLTKPGKNGEPPKLSKKEAKEILKQLGNGKLKRVLARTDERGTTFHEVNRINGDEAVVGGEFKF